MELLLRDFQYGLRYLMRNRSFALTVILTLLVGVGVNIGLFSLVSSILLRPLPYRDPNQLFQILIGTKGEVRSPWFSAVGFQHIQAIAETWEGVAVYGYRSLTDLNGNEPATVFGAAVYPESISVLGIQPLLGSSFPRADSGGGNSTILISHKYWRERFNGNPAVIGQVLHFKEGAYQLVGVMPERFHFPELNIAGDEVRFWIPFKMTNDDLKNESSFTFQVVARTKNRVTQKQAQAALNVLANRLAKESPQWNTDRAFRLVPLKDYIVGNVRRTLWLLFGCVVVILAIAFSNVINILLAAGYSRKLELAIRLSLGAGRFQLLRQLSAESLLLSILACSGAVLAARWGLHMLRSVLPSNLPRAGEISLDAITFAAVTGVALGTALIGGCVGAIQVWRLNLPLRLKQALGSETTKVGRLPLRSALVVLQIALAFTLLSATGLLIRSYWLLNNVPLGFEPRNVLSVRISPPAILQKTNEILGYYPELARRIEHFPGVESVGFVDVLPLSRMNTSVGFQIEGGDGSKEFGADRRIVTAGYFKAMRIPLLQGRQFSDADTETSEGVAIVNEAMAAKYWPNESPLTRRIIGGRRGTLRIVGIAGNVRHSGPEAGIAPEIYLPLSQNGEQYSMRLVVRTSQMSSQLPVAIRRELLRLNPTWPIDAVSSMEQLLDGFFASRRLVLFTISSFGVIGLILAVVGVYGLTSYSVLLRTHEIGVRIAIGGQRRAILGMILYDGIKLAGMGMLLGFAGSLAATQVLRGALYGVTPNDFWTFLSVLLLLAGAALAACLFPAVRAMNVDPVVALQCR